MMMAKGRRRRVRRTRRREGISGGFCRMIRVKGGAERRARRR